MTQLQNGDRFPTLTGQTLAHGEVTIPDVFPADHYGVVLVYRAHW